MNKDTENTGTTVSNPKEFVLGVCGPEQVELKRERAREKRRWMRENDPEAYRAWLDHRNMLARERRKAKKAAQTAGKEST